MKASIEHIENGLLVTIEDRKYVFPFDNTNVPRYRYLRTLLNVYQFLVGKEGFNFQLPQKEQHIKMVIDLVEKQEPW